MLSPMKNQVSSGRQVPVADRSCTSIWPITTPPGSDTPASGIPLGELVITIFTHDIPVKSNECARVRTWFSTVGTTVVQVPSLPLVESAETSMWYSVGSP